MYNNYNIDEGIEKGLNDPRFTSKDFWFQWTKYCGNTWSNIIYLSLTNKCAVYLL